MPIANQTSVARRLAAGALAILASAFVTSNALAVTDTYDVSTSWQVPAGVTKITIDAWGGGASGGPATGKRQLANHMDWLRMFITRRREFLLSQKELSKGQ